MARFLASFPFVRQLLQIRDGVYEIRDLLREIAASQAMIARRSRAGGEQLAELLLASDSFADERSLNRFEHRVYSQFGEDGILAEIFNRIGLANRRFVEFGVQDGTETNSTYLLSRGWCGTWIDADSVSLRQARERFREPISAGRLEIIEAFVTRENATALLHEVGVPTEFDLLSLDIDRNTYHLWQGLAGFRPRVVVTEYNASIPPSHEWVVDYDPYGRDDGSVNFGASLKSFERLADELGYRLVGCGLSGVNAFFVRADLVGESFLPPFTAETHYQPPRYWLEWRAGHPQSANQGHDPSRARDEISR